jgi:FemAB-related protein (PEP-CTERM system-associated)
VFNEEMGTSLEPVLQHREKLALRVEYLSADSPQDDAKWDHFVRSSPNGTVFHLSQWRRAVADVYRHTPHYLVATDGDEIRGALPLFEIHGLLSGRVFVSVPYAVYGGLCGTDVVARKMLLEKAEQLAKRQGARYVELRHLSHPEPGLSTKSLYMTFYKPLDADPEVNFEAIPRKQRRMVRVAMKNNLEVRRGWEHLGEFFQIFVENKRRLGSPAFPRKFFETIRDYFAKDIELLTIWHQGKMVAGVISFFFGDRVMPYYGAAREEAFSLAVNDFMYWEVMRFSCLAGYRGFDFGRSREGTGAYNFKHHWGFEPQPLAYQYLMVTAQKIPNINPSNPRFQWFIETWKRLPLPVTRWLGPPLTRWLPLD